MKDFLEGVGRLGVAFGFLAAGTGVGVAHVFQQLGGQVRSGQHVIHKFGSQRRARHRVELGRFGGLHHHHPKIFHHHFQPQRTIRAQSRADNAHGAFAGILSQALKKKIDGQATAQRLSRREQQEYPVQNTHVAVWRDDVDVVRTHAQAVGSSQNLHFGEVLKHLHQLRILVGRKVGNHHETHAAVCRHGPKELFKRHQRARRAAQPHQRKSGRMVVVRHLVQQRGCHGLVAVARHVLKRSDNDAGFVAGLGRVLGTHGLKSKQVFQLETNLPQKPPATGFSYALAVNQEKKPVYPL